jgi:hypothetical protein
VALQQRPVRSLVAIVLAAAVLSGSGAMLNVPQLERARQLIGGIVEDLAAIASSFAGGPNDPKSPVLDQSSLARDKARLEAATQKAEQLADELRRLRGSDPGRGP